MILSYARVSTVEQAADSATSLAEQIRKCKGWAMMQDACGPYDFVEYVDKGVSGAMPLAERPYGKQLLADAKEGDTVVATKLDRLFRSASDALSTVEELRKRGVQVVLLDMGNESLTANGTAKLFFSILAAIAEFERERIAERMTEGKSAKRRLGGHTGGSPPYGYRVSGSGDLAMLEPDPDEQEVIRQIVKLANGKRRVSDIRHWLNKEGIPTRGKKPWQHVQVGNIIEHYRQRMNVQ